MKKFILSLLMAMWLVATPAYSIEPGLVNVTELDDVPAPWVYKLIFPNGTVTDNADGTVTIATGTGAGSGDFSSDTATSVDSELILFKSTTGKLGKRATLTGLPYLTSGVLGTSKVTLTQPGTGSTLTILDGKTLTINKTMTLTGAGDTSVITLPAGAVSIPVFGTLTDTKYCTYSTASGLVCTSDGTAGSGDVATDTIWDAAGDLAIGTGVDTAARLPKGAANTILHMKSDASTAEWTSWTILTPTTGGILYGTGTGVYTPLAKGTAGQLLNMNVGATAPAWTSTISGITITGDTASKGACFDGSKNLVACTNLTDVTPLVSGGALGTPASGTMTNVTGLPKVSSTAYGATTSAELAGVISDETGTDKLVYNTSPTLITPALGTPSAIVLTNATGFPSSPPGIVERLGATFDGGGSAIAVNKIAYAHIPFAVTAINQWTILCDVDSGAAGIIITPYMDAYSADTLPTTTMCTSGTIPHVDTGAHKTNQASWDCNITAIPADRVIAFKVTTAPTSSTWCTITLKVTR